ncbi:MAG: hypothetical protein PF508_00870 [Spirochaeta sp.]|nr:hypothetical protein [Spirochaeta sp.]
MQLIHIADIRAPLGNDHFSWALGHAQTANADLVVCTGDIAADPRRGVYKQVAGTVSEGAVDAVFTPGEGDDRTAFFEAFGRRYRIDPPYRYLDRLVRVAGVPLLLIDSADGTLAEEQLLWLQSQLHDLHRAVVRGESCNDLLLFSHRSLLPDSDQPHTQSPITNADEIEEILSAYRAGRHRLRISLFSGGWSGRGPQHPAGLHSHGTPPFGTERGAIRLISVNAGEPLETVLVYPARASENEENKSGGDASSR